jgi:nucleoid-associated protein YgaU
MAFKKAKIIIHKESGTEELSVLFNPAEYSLAEAANYAEKNVPGLGGPITQFVSGAASTLTMTLIFDTYETSPDEAGGDVARKMDAQSGTTKVTPTDVSLLTRKITALVNIDGSLHRPPICEFAWGSLKFKGVLTNVNQTYTMFMEDGKPVRAKLDVTFKSVMDMTEGKKKAPFESPDRTKRRIVKQNVHLWELAWEEYGDPSLWRVIARENGLLNPLDLKPGQVVKLPAL